MFETATFDSMGTIHTRSRNWMLATFSFNASILVLLIAIPLLHPSMLPQVLPQMMCCILIPPVQEAPPVVRQQAPAAASPSTSSSAKIPANAIISALVRMCITHCLINFRHYDAPHHTATIKGTSHELT